MKKELTPFGRCFVSIRKKRKQTLKEAAEQLDCSPSLLSAIEHGDRSLSDKLLDKILSTYDLDDTERQQIRIASAMDITRKISLNELKQTLINFLENLSKTPEEETKFLKQIEKFISDLADNSYNLFDK